MIGFIENIANIACISSKMWEFQKIGISDLDLRIAQIDPSRHVSMDAARAVK